MKQHFSEKYVDGLHCILLVVVLIKHVRCSVKFIDLQSYDSAVCLYDFT